MPKRGKSPVCDCGCGQRNSGRSRKAECPSCGALGYFSRSTMVAPGLPVCRCGMPFEASCLNDRATYDPDGAYALMMENVGGRSLTGRRAMPENRYEDRATCKGCRRFLKHAHAHCSSCGQNNSRDGWTTRLAGKSQPTAAIPF